MKCKEVRSGRVRTVCDLCGQPKLECKFVPPGDLRRINGEWAESLSIPVNHRVEESYSLDFCSLCMATRPDAPLEFMQRIREVWLDFRSHAEGGGVGAFCVWMNNSARGKVPPGLALAHWNGHTGEYEFAYFPS